MQSSEEWRKLPGGQVIPKSVVPMEEEEALVVTCSMYALVLRCSDQEVILFWLDTLFSAVSYSCLLAWSSAAVDGQMYSILGYSRGVSVRRESRLPL